MTTIRDCYHAHIVSVLRAQLDRERTVIAAMHRQRHLHILRRKPWRSRVKPIEGSTLRVKISSLWQWLRKAHDCADPAIGCSCSGSFRFPNPVETTDTRIARGYE